MGYDILRMLVAQKVLVLFPPEKGVASEIGLQEQILDKVLQVKGTVQTVAKGSYS